MKKYLVHLLFLLYVVVFLLMNYPPQATFDFLNYYFDPSLFQLDWHPVWMKQKLHVISDLLFSEENKRSGMTHLCFIYSAVLWVGSNLLILHALRARFYASCVYIFLLFLIHFAWPAQLSLVGADMGFFVHVFLLIAICAFATEKNYKARWLFYILLILLWDTVTWRHQAILLVPFFIWYISRFHPRMLHFSWKKRVSVALLSTIVVFSSTQILYYKILAAKKSWPQVAMIYSDIENISSLRKDTSFKAEFQNEFGFVPHPKISATAHLDIEYPLGQYFGYIDIETQGQKREAIDYKLRYNFLKSQWLNKIKASPQDFILARAVNYIQLLYSGYVPPPVLGFVKNHYPHITVYSLAGAYSRHSRPVSYFLEKREAGASLANLIIRDEAFKLRFSSFVIPVLYTLIYAWLLISLPLQYLRARVSTSSFLKMSYLCSLVSIVYLIGFLPYTPTCDTRFTAPSLIIGLLGMFFYVLSLQKAKKKETKPVSHVIA